MHEPVTTAGKIDAFEARFTQVGGAHFLIAEKGEEAWPISAGEAAAFKGLHRRRMERAQQIRRLAVLVPFLLLPLNALLADAPRAVTGTLGLITFLLFMPGILLGFFQHALTDEWTRRGIERQLKHRLTTRQPEAITLALTPRGRFARRLLGFCVALEIGMFLLHPLLGPNAIGEHLQIMFGQAQGNEGLAAQITGRLSWAVHLAALIAVAMLVLDRHQRERERDALRAEAPERKGNPVTTPR